MRLLPGDNYDFRDDDARMLDVVNRRTSVLCWRLAVLPHPLLRSRLHGCDAHVPELPSNAWHVAWKLLGERAELASIHISRATNSCNVSLI